MVLTRSPSLPPLAAPLRCQVELRDDAKAAKLNIADHPKGRTLGDTEAERQRQAAAGAAKKAGGRLFGLGGKAASSSSSSSSSDSPPPGGGSGASLDGGGKGGGVVDLKQRVLLRKMDTMALLEAGPMGDASLTKAEAAEQVAGSNGGRG